MTFNVMLKPRGAICNFDCQYCYYLSKENLYPGSSFRMSDELLETYTRQMLNAQQQAEVVFAWQGGEPTLMGLDFFHRAVVLQERYRRPVKAIAEAQPSQADFRPGEEVKIVNALQTNGLLLDDAWGQFFRQHNFLIGLSLDGPQALHDKYRRDKGGQPTFDRVMAGLSLLQKHQVDYNLLCCVSAANVQHPLEVYRFFRDTVGAQFIQFIPIVERQRTPGARRRKTGEAALTERSVSGEAFGQFLITIFDEWVRRDVGRVFVQIFDVTLGIWHTGQAGLCVFAPTCGQAMALEHNGDLYACDHFVEPRYRLGNLLQTPLKTLVNSEKQARFGEAKRDSLPRFCLECEVRFLCNGECPKNRLSITPEGEKGLNVLCAGYKAFFIHTAPAMQTMSALIKMGRAPAEIMLEAEVRQE